MKNNGSIITRDAAEAAGFAPFNNGPHMCVEVPDGVFTITARTSSGKKVTIAFMPYRDGGDAGCIDIYQHDVERQRPILFTKGSDVFHWKRSDAVVATTTLALEGD